MNKMRAKLIVLYMLDTVRGHLSTAQISGFLLREEKAADFSGRDERISGNAQPDKIDYFTFQAILEEMLDADLVYKEQSYNRTLFSITDTGRETLRCYLTQITPSLEEEILSYLEENAIEIREQLTVYSDLYKSTDGNYVAVCQLRERDTKIVDLSLTVSAETQAKAVCRQWLAHYEELYAVLMDTLVQ